MTIFQPLPQIVLAKETVNIWVAPEKLYLLRLNLVVDHFSYRMAASPEACTTAIFVLRDYVVVWSDTCNVHYLPEPPGPARSAWDLALNLHASVTRAGSVLQALEELTK